MPEARGTRAGRRQGSNQRKGFTGTGRARFADEAHQQFDSPVVLVWDGLNIHLGRAMCDSTSAIPQLKIVLSSPAPQNASQAIRCLHCRPNPLRHP